MEAEVLSEYCPEAYRAGIEVIWRRSGCVNVGVEEDAAERQRLGSTSCRQCRCRPGRCCSKASKSAREEITVAATVRNSVWTTSYSTWTWTKTCARFGSPGQLIWGRRQKPSDEQRGKEFGTTGPTQPSHDGGVLVLHGSSIAVGDGNRQTQRVRPLQGLRRGRLLQD
jgi:hypothetical protein